MRPLGRGRHSLVAVGVPALVVTLGVGGMLVTSPRTDGPLTATSSVRVGFELAIRRTGTWGIVLPTNSTISPITIEAIEAIDARGVAIVGMVLNDPERDGGIGTLDAYPPPGIDATDVEGAVLPAIGGDAPYRQLLVGVRLSGTGTGSIDGLRVRYRHDGTPYEVVLPYALRLRPSGG